MPFCTSCGSQMDGSFCTNCGAPAESGAAGAGQPARPAAESSRPPAPVAAAPPPKKTSPVIWVLAGCFGLIVIVGIALTVGGFFVAHKVKQVVDVDKGTITLPGKDGEKVELKVKGDGESGAIEVKTSEGTARFGAGSAANIPSWMPAYPGSQPEGAFSAQGKDGAGGAYGFKTSDSIEKVLEFYEREFKSAGLETSKNIVNQNDKSFSGMVTARDSAGKREAHVGATVEDTGTRVGISYKGE